MLCRYVTIIQGVSQMTTFFDDFIIESKKVPDVIKEKKNNNSFSEKNKKN